MSDKNLTPNLVKQACDIITTTVKSLPLNYNITETPFSIYLTLRKSLVKNIQSLENSKLENPEEKIKKLEKVINTLNVNLEDAVLECEENAKTICELEEKVEILCTKLEKSEEKHGKSDIKLKIKDTDILTMKEKNKTLVAENTDLKKELNHLIKTFNMSELDSSKTNKKLKVKIELLEDEVKTQNQKPMMLSR